MSTSGSRNCQNPILVNNSPKFQDFDLLSQVWYSCPKEENDSQNENLPYYSQVGYQDKDQDYYFYYALQDENDVENRDNNNELDSYSNSHLDNQLEDENQDSEVLMSTPIR